MWDDGQHRRREYPSESYVPSFGGVFESEYLLGSEHDANSQPDTSWDRKALQHIEAHLHGENEAVAAYEEMVKETSGAVEYLIELILADEYRHHHLLAELAKAVGSATGKPGYTSTEIPDPLPIDEELRLRLLAQTKKFIDIEHEDGKELRSILTDLRPSRTRTIWPLLVELMELDSEKHVKILKRIEHLLA